MKLVVDTSVVIAVITNEAHKPTLVRLTEGADLIAPISLPLEIGNAFSAMFKRNRITLADAHMALAAYRQIPLQLTEVALEHALELAALLDVYAYDAYMIACARQQDCPLVTLDQGLRATAKRARIDLMEVLE